ncbi:hypothetical protein JG688_00003278 [Phytophthora aleatoria]|uniref:Uncharacterized protein n=1 Tax=Phytophthora aleatoria TaxID=2496075 RepID=A0A8J5JAI6_9STRA|nr:hypothetical protein JG688_00003278 [Phytophthora aleatoria]
MELVHEGMLSPYGLSSTVENIKRRREKRNHKLLCLFADQVRKRNRQHGWRSHAYTALFVSKSCDAPK